jgi:hypothetical protein
MGPAEPGGVDGPTRIPIRILISQVAFWCGLAVDSNLATDAAQEEANGHPAW